MVKSHKHGSAVYYKHWSEDPSKGRKSIVKVKNVRNKDYLSIPVDKIGLQENYFTEDLENFFNTVFESKHDEYMSIIEKIAGNQSNSTELKKLNPLIFNLIFRSPHNLGRINDFYLGRIDILNSLFPKIKKNEQNRDYIKNGGFQIDNEEPNIRHSQLFAEIHGKIANSRQFPLIVKQIKNSRLITSDNPILFTRINVGTIYTLTLNPEYFLCLGYIENESYFEKMMSVLSLFNPLPSEINIALENQAQTFIIV